MPELPEVETIVRRLHGLVVGKTISSIQVLRDKSFKGDVKKLVGGKISALSRKSKIIRFHFTSNINMLVHLKMTGQLIYIDDYVKVGGGHPTADWIQKLPSSHTRVIITFDDGSKLFFNDQRVFGWLWVLDDASVALEFEHLAPDIIDPELTANHLYVQLQKRRMPIKQVIMDNTVVAGVGNIYACDALNKAKIHPKRPAHSLTSRESKILFAALQHVVIRGIELEGATIAHFSQVDGFAGRYQHEARVYGRKGEACYNCGNIIIKEKLGGRGTYYCPSCQR